MTKKTTQHASINPLLILLAPFILASQIAHAKHWAPQRTGNVASNQITEASGIIVSKTQKNILWTFNDSGDSPRIFALKPDGSDLGQFKLKNAKNKDFEDIALGPGPQKNTPYLYIADIGDNDAKRTTITLYRFPEPTINPQKHKKNTTLKNIQTITLKYPDHPHDAETLIIDPLNGDIFIGTKRGPTFNLYRVTQKQITQNPNAIITLTKAATIVEPQLHFAGFQHFVTAGDISTDGKYIAIRSRNTALFYKRNKKQSVPQALKTKPIVVQLFDLISARQGEAIAFDPQGYGFYTLDEGRARPIYHYPWPKQGDFNSDQVINQQDMQILQNNLGFKDNYPSAKSLSKGDYNLDGQVNRHDASAFQAQFQIHPNPSPYKIVPIALTLIACTAGIFWIQKKRNQ